MVRAVIKQHLHSSFRTLLIASLGFGFTACVAENQKPSHWGQHFGQTISARYSPSYRPVTAPQQPYVLQAQNNIAPHLRAPQLRGLSSTSQPVYQQNYYRDYPAETSLNHPPSQAVQRTQSYESGLVYQLDDTMMPAIQKTYLPSPQAMQSQKAHSVQPSHNSYVDSATTYSAHGKSYIAASDKASTQRPVISRPVSQRGANQSSTDTVYTSETPNLTTITSTGTTVNQSLHTARETSPRLAIEDIKIREAEEGLEQAKAQGRFKLDLNGVVGPAFSETDFRVVDSTTTDFRVRRGANLDLSLPIFDGGLINAQKDIARVGIESAKADYETVESAVTQEAAIAHVNVIRDRQLIEIYSRNVTLLEQQKKNVNAMVLAGENTLTDEALIDARLAAIKVRLEQVKSELASSESNYKKLVGSPAPSLMPVGLVELPTSLQDIKEAARSNNSQLKAAHNRAESANHNIEVAKSFGRPKLALQGVLRAAEGQSETIRRNSAAEVLLNFSVPLLSGGENKSRVRQAALAQSRALLETRDMQNNLDERLEQLWARVQAASRSKAPNQAQKLAAQKAYDAIVQQRDAGVATSLDVLSVEQTLLDAELNLVEAENIEDVARFQLLGLMGSL